MLPMLILLSGDVAKNPGPNVDTECLSILHLNIRSIRNKLPYIENTFTEFDILCFTETHLSSDISTDTLLLKAIGRRIGKIKLPTLVASWFNVADSLLI